MNIHTIRFRIGALGMILVFMLTLIAASSPPASTQAHANEPAQAGAPSPSATTPPTNDSDENSEESGDEFDLTLDAPFTGLEYEAAPPTVRPDVPLVVRQPAPSDINPALLGPVQLIKSAKIDREAGTATMPLFEGKMDSGESVWYVLTDTSDRGISEVLGVNYAPKLIYADIARGVRRATVDGDGIVAFRRGKVDFSPELSVTPSTGENPFPPAKAQPGSVGDDFYTPLFKTTNANADVVYNAPVVAFGTSAKDLNTMCEGDPDYEIVHDKVASICPRDKTVTLKLTLGYSFAKPIWYVSFDANTEIAATLEGSTLTPVYDELGIRLQDAAIGSGQERLLAVTNGPTGTDNPNRQGFNSALRDGRDPINVFGGIPTINLDYSPLWDLMLLQWSDEAIEKGYRTRLIDAFQALQYETRGFITSPEGGRVESSGIVINCPVFLRFN